MKTFKKKFLSAERFLNDLEAREHMPSWAVPEIYAIDTVNLTAEYEFFSCPMSISDNSDLMSLVEFFSNVHKYIEVSFSRLIHENREAEIPRYGNTTEINEMNQKVLSLLGIGGFYLPVKIGDLKPEHLFITDNNTIKICDYETVGLGLLLEDMAFLPLCCEATPWLDFKGALGYYLYCRYGVTPDAQSITRSINQVSAFLASQLPFFEAYKNYWE